MCFDDHKGYRTVFIVEKQMHITALGNCMQLLWHKVKSLLFKELKQMIKTGRSYGEHEQVIYNIEKGGNTQGCGSWFTLIWNRSVDLNEMTFIFTC